MVGDLSNTLEKDVLLNPSKEGFTLLMANPDWKVSTPARFWFYREVPNERVQEFLEQHGWARCPTRSPDP